MIYNGERNFDYEELIIACRDSNIKKIKDILERGNYINGLEEYYVTPLYVASGNVKTIRFLLENGANINQLVYVNGYAQSILQLLIESIATAYYDNFLDNLEIESIEFLICNGTSINKTDENRYTPLDWSIKYAHKPAEELLKKRGGKNSYAFLSTEYKFYSKKFVDINKTDYIERDFTPNQDIENFKGNPYHLEILFSIMWNKLGFSKSLRKDNL